MEEKEAKNPTDIIYGRLGSDLSCQSDDEMNELKPVEVIVEKMDNILNVIYQNMMVGEHFTDISKLNVDNSFILISNHIHPSMRSSFVTKFNRYEEIPNNVSNYLNPHHGLANSLAIRNQSEDSSTRIFVGFDSGHILMFDPKLSLLSTKQFGHNIITKIALSPQQKQERLVCGDQDGRLVLIDIDKDMESISYYDNAHSDPINDLVFCSNGCDNKIITAGGDNSILLWDFRISRTDRPALTIAQVNSQPTALDWPTEHELTFGTEAGNLVRLDLRNSDKVLQKLSLFNNQDELDMNVVQIRPVRQNLICVLTAHQHWLFERQNLDKIIDNYSEYSERVHLKSCLAIDDTDLLIIGNNFNCFRYPKILL